MTKRIACGLVCGAVLLISAAIMSGHSGRPSGGSLDEIIAKLESGELGAGSTFHKPKGWTGVGRDAADGQRLAVSVYWGLERCLALYECDQKLYAACLFQYVIEYEEREKWYFCDETLFALHLKTALAAKAGAREGGEQVEGNGKKESPPSDKGKKPVPADGNAVK